MHTYVRHHTVGALEDVVYLCFECPHCRTRCGTYYMEHFYDIACINCGSVETLDIELEWFL